MSKAILTRPRENACFSLTPLKAVMLAALLLRDRADRLVPRNQCTTRDATYHAKDLAGEGSQSYCIVSASTSMAAG